MCVENENLKLNPLGLEVIKHFEGFKPEPYRDPVGYWTIGYGHLISTNRSIDRTEALEGLWSRRILAPGRDRILPPEAEALLRRDTQQFEHRVKGLVSVPLTSNQFSALVSFAYNVGDGALARSTLLRELNKEQYDIAAEEFHRWKHAGGRALTGLERRRAVEAWLFSLSDDLVVDYSIQLKKEGSV